MPQIAASALFSALAVLVASLLWAIADFICGGFLAIEPTLVVFPLSAALIVGLIGTVGFGFVLIVQTLLRRAHWRYVVALFVIVALWLPAPMLRPYLRGMSGALWFHGISEEQLVAFAVSSRFENTEGSVPWRRITSSLRAANHEVGDVMPDYAVLYDTAEHVDIVWGGAFTGRRGIRIFDGTVDARALEEELASYRRVSPRVYVFWQSM